jgi:hypothetical protein
MALNAEQQLNLFKAIKNNDLGGNSQPSVQVNIENFSGNSDELSKLEDMLYKLQSSNRFKFA